ncbi:MSHA biogenesis protein MshI [Marinimicrobium sp. C6131]|uniref:MSHA biogenesis protein MshI n=1 Tax=Marinimicrobium sp. C6131 TaxID=3022676 RepID=UPI00223DDF1B|nr:MSHA biogenesis protein MshI [Marinimicrobium sp. C6131]UZJ45930.1 MSHA biogenesis protein MshI [Marinimicrobium sp. C6131]
MQQVNLYLPEFHPRRVWLSLTQMIAAIAAVLVLIVGLSLWSGAYTDSLQARLTSERAELDALQRQVQQLMAELPARRGATVEEQVARLRQEIQRREQILQLMSQQNLGNAEGFSGQLSSLSHHALDDLALARFSLQSGGQYVELAGRVRKPEQVPLYLQQLRRDQSFSGVSFGVLEVAREPDDRGPGLMFSVQRALADDASVRGGRSGD